MVAFVMIIVLGTMGLSLIRAARGPTVYDRILAANAFSTKTIVTLVIFGFLVGDPALYLDIAMMYALIGFIGTVAVLKVSEFGDLGYSKQRPPDESE